MGYTAIYYTIISSACIECTGLECECTLAQQGLHNYIGEVKGTFNAPLYLTVKSTSKKKSSVSVNIIQNLFKYQNEYLLSRDEEYTIALEQDNVYISSYDSLAMTNSYILFDNTDKFWHLNEKGPEDEAKLLIYMYQYCHDYYPANTKEEQEQEIKWCECLEQSDAKGLKCHCGSPEAATHHTSSAVVILPTGHSNITIEAPQAKYFVGIAQGSSINKVHLGKPSFGYFEMFDVLNEISVKREQSLDKGIVPHYDCNVVFMASNSALYDFSDSKCAFYMFTLYGLKNGIRPSMPGGFSNVVCYDNVKYYGREDKCEPLLSSNKGGNMDSTIVMSDASLLRYYAVTCEDLDIAESETTESRSAFIYGYKDYTGSNTKAQACGSFKLALDEDSELVKYLESYDHLVTFINDIKTFDFSRPYIRGLSSDWTEFERFDIHEGISVYITELSTRHLKGNMSRMTVFWLNSTDVDVTANVGRLQLDICPGDGCFSGRYELISPHAALKDSNSVTYTTENFRSTKDRVYGYVGGFDDTHSMRLTAKNDFGILEIVDTPREVLSSTDAVWISFLVSLVPCSIIIPLLVKFWCLRRQRQAYDVTVSTEGGSTCEDTTSYVTSGPLSVMEYLQSRTVSRESQDSV